MIDLRKELPAEVLAKAENTLRSFETVYVTQENGTYRTSLTQRNVPLNDPNYNLLGIFTQTDFFTEQERIENYINTYYAYPPNYRGKRDNLLLHKMRVESYFEDDILYQWYGALNEEGDFELRVRTPYRKL